MRICGLVAIVFLCTSCGSDLQIGAQDPLTELCALCADLEYNCWGNTEYDIDNCVDWHRNYNTINVSSVHISEVSSMIYIGNCVSPTLWVCTYPYKAVQVEI